MSHIATFVLMKKPSQLVNGDEIEAKSYLQEAIRESEGQSEHYQFTERVGRLIASLEGRKAWLLLTMA
jgi:hypothetical protein